MKFTISAWSSTDEDYDLRLSYIVPKVCPLCSTSYAHSPEYMSFHSINQVEISTAALFFCPACEGYFLEYGTWGRMGNDWHIASRYLLPVNKRTTIFSDRIKSISNSFVKYYSEA